MAKKDRLMNEQYEIDIDPTSAAAISKLPGNISGGATTLTDYMTIPCDKIVEYQQKGDGDFSPWPEDRFETLVDSIKKVGVIEAVTVRVSPKNPGIYEMLSGEHRWKASVAAGLETVPAHVLRDCDDNFARGIFYMTNLMRRELSLHDRILGWSEYVNLTRYKRGEKINQMIEEGVLSQDFAKGNLSMRQIYRYAHCARLLPKYIQMVEEGTISLSIADELAYLDREQMEELLPFAKDVKTEAMAKDIHKLALGGIPGKEWSVRTLKTLIYPPERKERQTSSFSSVTKHASNILRMRLNPSFYGDAETILEEAMTLYFEQHPEREVSKEKQQKMRDKAAKKAIKKTSEGATEEVTGKGSKEDS